MMGKNTKKKKGNDTVGNTIPMHEKRKHKNIEGGWAISGDFGHQGQWADVRPAGMRPFPRGRDGTTSPTAVRLQDGRTAPLRALAATNPVLEKNLDFMRAAMAMGMQLDVE